MSEYKTNHILVDSRDPKCDWRIIWDKGKPMEYGKSSEVTAFVKSHCCYQEYDCRFPADSVRWIPNALESMQRNYLEYTRLRPVSYPLGCFAIAIYDVPSLPKLKQVGIRLYYVGDGHRRYQSLPHYPIQGHRFGVCNVSIANNKSAILTGDWIYGLGWAYEGKYNHDCLAVPDPRDVKYICETLPSNLYKKVFIPVGTFCIEDCIKALHYRNIQAEKIPVKDLTKPIQ